ncbi:MAG: SpoIIE family protein phosphatase [Bacteroidia bacterium]|nr:SpoIIE family protein phosphatase [Bacteroidia bacterium]
MENSDSLFGDKNLKKPEKETLFGSSGSLFGNIDPFEIKQANIFFARDNDANAGSEKVWKVLIVDDEEDIHSVTRIALRNFSYNNRNIQYFDAYSASQASEILHQHGDIAVILLDVVMETNNAGLELVKQIREKFNNPFSRIILRTGQPGQAPEREVIDKYEINDYKTKTELTQDRLYTVMMASLRAFESLMIIESFRKDLEQKVIERTAEVVRQKEEIKRQKQEITDSIVYARRIQSAVLPPNDFISKVLPQHFIIFRPKDIVSGDFYYVLEINNVIVTAIADCTGHGVPGGFMSMLSIAFLTEIVNKREITTAAAVLNHLRAYIIKSLHQAGHDDNIASIPGLSEGCEIYAKILVKDGMDISLCVIEKDKNQIQYAGANNPLYIIQTVAKQPFELKEIRPDKMPVGVHYGELQPFTNHELPISPGNMVYLISDGIADQFGGPRGKKFKYVQFKHLLSSIYMKTMEEQKNIIESALDDWMNHTNPDTDNKYLQIDDITVFGIKI